jgi:hypothetical protein
MSYWMADADYIYWDEKDQWILGEDQNADWWVPYVPADMRPYWDRFNKWHPLHWACYWRSRRRNQVCRVFHMSKDYDPHAIMDEIRNIIWIDIGEQYPRISKTDRGDLTFMEFADDCAKAICNRYTLTPKDGTT